MERPCDAALAGAGAIAGHRDRSCDQAGGRDTMAVLTITSAAAASESSDEWAAKMAKKVIASRSPFAPCGGVSMVVITLD